MATFEDAYRVLGLDPDALPGEVMLRYQEILSEDTLLPSGRRRTNLPAVRHAYRVILKRFGQQGLDLEWEDEDNDDCWWTDAFYAPVENDEVDPFRETKFSRPRPRPDEGYRTNVDGAAVEAHATSLVKEEENEKHGDKKTKKKKKKKKKKKSDASSIVSVNNNCSDVRDENNSCSDSDEEGLDPNSAFVKAARKVPGEKSTVTNGNRAETSRSAGRAAPAQGGAAGSTDPPDTVRREAQRLAIRGNQLAGQGDFQEAIALFTQAIKLDPEEHRFPGNRSFCFERLKQYDKALRDADRAIEIDPSWAKGYFRRGRALLGHMKYREAEEAYRRVLELDKEAKEDCYREIEKIRVYKLMNMGFSKKRSWSAVKQYKTEQAAVEGLLRGDVQDLADDSFGSDDDTGEPVAGRPVDPKEDPSNVHGLTSLWVGNIKESVTERDLVDLFSRHGAVTSVRVLPDRYCAFINFSDKNSASLAMQHLQGHHFHGSLLKIKFPDNPIVNGQQKIVLGKKGPGPAVGGVRRMSGTIGDGECLYWRSIGCSYGDACKFKHIPANKGVDRKPWRKS